MKRNVIKPKVEVDYWTGVGFKEMYPEENLKGFLESLKGLDRNTEDKLWMVIEVRTEIPANPDKFDNLTQTIAVELARSNLYIPSQADPGIPVRDDCVVPFRVGYSSDDPGLISGRTTEKFLNIFQANKFSMVFTEIHLWAKFGHIERSAFIRGSLFRPEVGCPLPLLYIDEEPNMIPMGHGREEWCRYALLSHEINGKPSPSEDVL